MALTMAMVMIGASPPGSGGGGSGGSASARICLTVETTREWWTYPALPSQQGLLNPSCIFGIQTQS